MACKGTNKRGGPCKAKVVRKSDYCYFHNAALSGKRRAAQSQGGRARRPSRLPLPPLNFHFDDPATIARTLSVVAELVYLGQLSAKRAGAIARLAAIALDALDASKVAEEVAHVKAIAEAEKMFSPDSTDATKFKQAEEDASFRSQLVELSRQIEQQEQERLQREEQERLEQQEPESASRDSVPPQKNGSDQEAQ